MSSIYTYRTLARIVLEAETPLKIGSGEKDITTDAGISLDVNGLPYIPGSAIAGVIRHALPEDLVEKVFGSSKNHTGSEIIFTDANLMYEQGRTVDGILSEKPPFLKIYDDLPIRQHVCIGHRGAAENHGKYDEAVIFAGSRFCFEMELLSGAEGTETMGRILSVLYRSHFRLGGGSRKGFGKVKVIKADIASLNLSKEEDLRLYLAKSASLNAKWAGWAPFRSLSSTEDPDWVTRTVTLKPEDFFLFSSGFGDDDADSAPVKETRVAWNGDIPAIGTEFCLVPGSSVKGALAHRVAYHYNRLTGQFADKVSPEEITGQNNAAVKALFGDTAARGRVIISDLFIKGDTKLINHNSIDDFTGGTLDGHLFTEKVLFGNDLSLILEISVDEAAFGTEEVRVALNCAIADLCNGRLPLGNGVNKGHGAFKGTIDKPF